MPRSRTNDHSKTKTVKRAVLRDIVRRVVDVAQPEKIILFGSAARGSMGPNSDVDLLVIKRGRFDRGQLVERIYLGMHGAAEAVDVIVVTPEEVERYRDEFCLVIYPALREGKVVYAAKATAAK
ncbi:MAG TPA: nucleotidyltransferase domain-containing protein [Pirellulales bacterium]|jgi:predicted nucleotidyltransferase|nr:nucleotidyltransferase domain-containing protein [Pirellulales bacterium]